MLTVELTGKRETVYDSAAHQFELSVDSAALDGHLMLKRQHAQGTRRVLYLTKA